MILEDLRSYARRLHLALRAGEHDLLAFINRGARRAVALDDVQRRHVLAAVARHLGFRGWSHLTAVLAGTESDHGRLWVPSGAAGFTNIWCASYEEASTLRASTDGWLVPWQTQFVVVSATFLEEMLGLSPSDPDWERLGRDLARADDVDARGRLIGRAIRHRLGGRPQPVAA